MAFHVTIGRRESYRLLGVAAFIALAFALGVVSPRLGSIVLLTLAGAVLTEGLRQRFAGLRGRGRGRLTVGPG